jgi:hypothetical protein
MKKNTMFILVLGMIVSLSFNVYAKNKNQADKQPKATLDETLFFIDNALANYPPPPFKNGISAKQRLDWQRGGDGCSFPLRVLTERHYPEHKFMFEGKELTTRGSTEEGRAEFSLRDIDPSKIEIKESEIEFFTIGSRAQIHYWLKDKANWTGGNGFSSSFFWFSDAEIAKRVAKAFKHAVELCQDNGRELF